MIIVVPLSERVTHEYRSAPPVTPLPRQLKYMVGAGKAKPLIEPDGGGTVSFRA